MCKPAVEKGWIKEKLFQKPISAWLVHEWIKAGKE